MHGQKKWRKRTAEGLFEVEGLVLRWSLVSEPQWTTQHGGRGMCFSVQAQDKSHRELILQYPLGPYNKRPSFPQRPAFTTKTIEADVHRAILAGWEPSSRGKPFVYLVSDREAEVTTH